MNKFILQNIQNSRQVKSISDVLDIDKLFYINFDFDCDFPQPVPFCHACALVKREIFDFIHFDVGYKGNASREETDLFTRVSAAGYSIYYDSSAVQINLPRNIVLQKNSILKHKLRAAFYEFWNTYKYLRKNEKFLQTYYHTSENFQKLWICYMKDALYVKTSKFIKILLNSEKGKKFRKGEEMKKISDMLNWANDACVYWMHKNKKRDNHFWNNLLQMHF